MTTGLQAAAGAWATLQHLPEPQDRLRDYWPAGAANTAAEPPAQQDLPGTTARPEAEEADADSAGAVVPSEVLRAGRSRRQTMFGPELVSTQGHNAEADVFDVTWT